MRTANLLVLAFLSPPVWAATAGTSVHVVASAGGPQESAGLSDFEQASDVGSASAAAISPHAGASADGFANFGVLKVMAQGNSQSGGYNAAANATASWADIVTLNSSSFNGQQAKFTAIVSLQGFISPVDTGRGTVGMDFSIGLGGGFSINGAWDTNTPANASGFPSLGLSAQPGGSLFFSGFREVNFTVTLGNSFVMSEELRVGASSKPACESSSGPACMDGTSGSVDVDFGHSSYWGGITSIAVLNAGTGLFETKDLSLFSVGSVSGTDYLQSFVPNPVPVPAAVWMLGSALGLLASRRRRSR
jgi:hypothetical protein